MEVNVCNSVHPKFCMFIPVRPYCHHPEHQIIWSWLIGNWGRASLTNRYSTNNLLWFVACTTCRSENWWILLTFHLHVMGCLVPQQISKCPPLLHLESSLSCCPLDISWSLSSQETFTRSELSVICLKLHHPVYVIAGSNHQCQFVFWFPECIANFRDIRT